MTDTRSALLRAVVLHPAEDVPRLMYADFLDEFGDEHDRARAEFVRVQCAFRRLLAVPHAEVFMADKILDYAARETELRAAHESAWRHPVLSVMSGYAGVWKYSVTWLRGFPVVTCRLEDVGKDEHFPDRDGGHHEWHPTPWALACVRDGVSFKLTNVDGPLPHGVIAAAVREAMEKADSTTASVRAARDAAVTALVARTAFPEVQS